MVALFRKQVHGSPQVAVDILNVPFSCGHLLVPQDPLNGLGTDLVGICEEGERRSASVHGSRKT